MFFCASRPVDTFVGFMQKENLKKKLDDLLETYKECIKQSTELKI
jgi:thioredoxin-like negative regulator of GroEL